MHISQSTKDLLDKCTDEFVTKERTDSKTGAHGVNIKGKGVMNTVRLGDWGLLCQGSMLWAQGARTTRMPYTRRSNTPDSLTDSVSRSLTHFHYTVHTRPTK